MSSAISRPISRKTIQKPDGVLRFPQLAWAISLQRAEQRDPTRLPSWAALVLAVLNPAHSACSSLTPVRRARAPIDLPPTWSGYGSASHHLLNRSRASLTLYLDRSKLMILDRSK